MGVSSVTTAREEAGDVVRIVAAPPKSVAAFVKDSLRDTVAALLLSLREKDVAVWVDTMAARKHTRRRVMMITEDCESSKTDRGCYVRRLMLGNEDK